MPKAKIPTCRNPLIQDDRQDTLLNVAAVIHCLQHIDLKTGIDDEGELGMHLIMDTLRDAIRYEALERSE